MQPSPCEAPEASGLLLTPDLRGVGDCIAALPASTHTHLVDSVPKDAVDECTLTIWQLVSALQQAGFVMKATGTSKGIPLPLALQAIRSACFPGAPAAVCPLLAVSVSLCLLHGCRLFAEKCNASVTVHKSQCSRAHTFAHSDHASPTLTTSPQTSQSSGHALIRHLLLTKTPVLQNKHGGGSGGEALLAPLDPDAALQASDAFDVGVSLTYFEFVFACIGVAQVAITKEQPPLAKVRRCHAAYRVACANRSRARCRQHVCA